MENSATKPKVIGVVVYPGVTALDLVGPMEAFACVETESPRGKQKAYELVVIGIDEKPVRSESGLVLQPGCTFRDAPPLDTLLIPGGSGLRDIAVLKPVVLWLRRRAEKTRRVASACTGVYALAATGLLDGRRAATHWRFARDVAARFPKVRVDANALFVKDGKFYSSGGITAAIDLTLALIEEDHGPSVSLGVARELVMHLRRSGGQEQYSEPLQAQMRAGDRFADLTTWIVGNLDKDLTLESLARRAGKCARHFSRVFKATQGETPAVYVENLRLNEGRKQLTDTRATIDQIASLVGFRSADAFRRAFHQRVGVNPTTYRERFNAQRPRPKRGSGSGPMPAARRQ